MEPITYYRLTYDEQTTLRDVYLPLHHLCADEERADEIARLIRGNASDYTTTQAGNLKMAVAELCDIVLEQATTDYWERLGMPEAEGLAQMRLTEAKRLYALLTSLVGDKAKAV